MQVSISQPAGYHRIETPSCSSREVLAAAAELAHNSHSTVGVPDGVKQRGSSGVADCKSKTKKAEQAKEAVAKAVLVRTVLQRLHSVEFYYC